jgi:3-oxoadipate enol-lactonase
MRQALRVQGRHLAYVEAGAPGGRVLLLLHAFPLTADMWRPQMDAVPAGWRMIAPDLAGLGRSDDRPDEPPVFDDYPSDVIAILDRLGIDTAVVGGLSLGGYVALALARLAPDRLSGLVLADTKAPADDAQAREGRRRMLEVLAEHSGDGVADEMMPKLLSETTRQQRPALEHDLRSLILTNDPEGMRRAILRLRDRPDATPVLQSIAVPAAVIVGSEDRVTPPGEAERLVNGIRGASLHTIPGAGHLSSLENPTAFNDALFALLARV